MARSRVAIGGDGLHIWRVAANILNSCGELTRGGPSRAWGLGEELTTPHHKKPACYEILQGGLGF